MPILTLSFTFALPFHRSASFTNVSKLLVTQAKGFPPTLPTRFRLQQLQDLREVRLRIRVVWTDLERTAEVGGGFVELTQRPERNAQVVVRVGNIRIQRNRDAELRN